MGLHPVGALALRRFVIALVAVLITMGAHLAGAGHGISSVNLPVAGGAVGTVGLAALLVGRRSGSFRPRGPAATFAILAAVQVAAHFVMWATPWVVGLEMHHHGALVTPAMLLTHTAATVLLLPLIAGMERILATLVAAVRRLRRLLVCPVYGAAWMEVLPLMTGRWMPAPALSCAPARGPPPGTTPR